MAWFRYLRAIRCKEWIMRLFTNILDEGKRKYAPFDTKEAEVRFIAMYEGILIHFLDDVEINSGELHGLGAMPRSKALYTKGVTS